MSKILQLIEKVKQKTHELDNAEELKHLEPRITVADVCHCFLKNKSTPEVLSYFTTKLNKQPHVYHYALYSTAYEHEIPENRVIMHGILFKGLFDIYMQNFNKAFDNVLLADLQNKHNAKREIIDFTEYNNLPKRYRGMFVQYDADRYVLNIPHTDMVMSYNKKNKQALEKLLLRANMLIPVIYKETKKNAIVTTPSFVDKAFSTPTVSDEQLNTIRELHDIFVEIAKITFPVKVAHKNKKRDIYDEYKKEMNQKGTVLSAYNMSTDAKNIRSQNLENARHSFQQKKKSIRESYNQCRIDLIQALSENISVRIK